MSFLGWIILKCMACSYTNSWNGKKSSLLNTYERNRKRLNYMFWLLTAFIFFNPILSRFPYLYNLIFPFTSIRPHSNARFFLLVSSIFFHSWRGDMRMKWFSVVKWEFDPIIPMIYTIIKKDFFSGDYFVWGEFFLCFSFNLALFRFAWNPLHSIKWNVREWSR